MLKSIFIRENSEHGKSSWLSKGLVLFEIAFVFFAGTFAARFLLNALGIGSSKQAIQSATTTNFDTVTIIFSLLIRWSCVIGLAFLAGWLIARQSLRDYGLTIAHKPLWWHLRAGILTLAFGFLPVLFLLILRHHLHLTGGPSQWEVIENAPRGIDFWLFILASSVILPPLVEEIFFRGYAQTRLASAFRPVTAILTVAVLFVLAHVQYLDGSVVGTIMVPLLIWQVTVAGFSRFYTGSLIAPFTAHAIGNIPMRLPEQWILFVLLIGIVLWALIKYRKERGYLLLR